VVARVHHDALRAHARAGHHRYGLEWLGERKTR
jgi:hypothetical protein